MGIARVVYVSALAALLSGCGPGIWNAGDLADWVREQAEKQGCERDSIQLEDWYAEEGGSNVWRGRCTGPDGQPMSFGIDVDPVWKPSSG